MVDNSRFTSQEYADMHFIYGLCNNCLKNVHGTLSAEAPAIYTITHLLGFTNELLKLVVLYLNCIGCDRIAPIAAFRNVSLAHFEKNGLYPYHLQKLQHLMPEDLPRRLEFC